MIYRFREIASSQASIQSIKFNMPSLPSGVPISHNVFPVNEYENAFERISYGDCKHFEVHKAPKVAKWRVPEEVKINIRFGRLPDIFRFNKFNFVSASAKDFIEDVEKGIHQFISLRLLENSKTSMSVHDYYVLNIRRHVKILGQGDKQDLPNAKRDYLMTNFERDQLVGIEHNQNAMALLEKLPLWGHLGNPNTFFMSETFVSNATSLGLSGLKITSCDSDLKSQGVDPIFRIK